MTVLGRIARLVTTLVAAIAIAVRPWRDRRSAPRRRGDPAVHGARPARVGAATSARLEGGAGGDEPGRAVEGRRPRHRPAERAHRARDRRARQKGGVPLRVQAPGGRRAAVPSSRAGGFDIEYLVQTWGPADPAGGPGDRLGARTADGGRGPLQHQVRAVRSPTRFADVAGIDEIRDEVAEIAEVLRDPARFDAVGATLPRGIILHGASRDREDPARPRRRRRGRRARSSAPPARSSWRSTRASDRKRVRALFAAARKAAPAVVYIDEIDAVGGRRTGHASAGEREQTLDQLLAEMDGFANDPVQAGRGARLDEPPRRPRPGPRPLRAASTARSPSACRDARRAARSSTSTSAAARSTPGTDSAAIAAFTVGMAGADLAALCNEASFEAARAGTDSLSIPHFRQGPDAPGRRARSAAGGSCPTTSACWWPTTRWATRSWGTCRRTATPSSASP